MKAFWGIIISVIFLPWFLASLIGLIYVSKHGDLQWLVPVILGQYLLVFGTAGAVVIVSSKRKGLWIDAAAISVGAAAVVLPLVYHYGGEQTRSVVMQLIPVLAGAVFLLTGACGALATFIAQKRSSEKYRTPAEGRCVELRTRMGSGGTLLKCPVYQISLNGETVRLCKDVFTNAGVPNVGESRTVYIDENDLESYAEPIADRHEHRIGYLISVPFMAAGLVTLVMTAVC